jgi:hypothetical protein
MFICHSKSNINYKKYNYFIIPYLPFSSTHHFPFTLTSIYNFYLISPIYSVKNQIFRPTHFSVHYYYSTQIFMIFGKLTSQKNYFTNTALAPHISWWRCHRYSRRAVFGCSPRCHNHLRTIICLLLISY